MVHFADIHTTGQEKQKKLLEAEAGHFSIIKYAFSVQAFPALPGPKETG